MNQLETFRLPFLGAREDGETFEYLLLEISPEKTFITISNWMIGHVNLNLNEKIDLFIPDLLTTEYRFRNNISGIVTSIKNEEDNHTYLYEVTFQSTITAFATRKSFEEFAYTIPAESSLVDMLFQLIKDSLILKQGILVYLSHLAPYFSRIINLPEVDYSTLAKFLFDDVNRRIKTNEKNLNDLYHLLKEQVKDISDISIFLNLEELREIMESEISLDLFLITFAEVDTQQELLTLLKESKYQDEYLFKYKFLNYLIAIKNLEKRLYSNYNQIVLIYLKSI